jgi:hypothetical protein
VRHLRILFGCDGTSAANFRREISAMMTWAQTSARIHVAAYEASREPASRYFGDMLKVAIIIGSTRPGRGPDPRELPTKELRTRDIHFPDLRIDTIKMKTREFR